ncbi:MAG: tetratricopeptide repeat protein [Chloroflexota bacterium]|nr:tetratricopeptide repeat protein [Chloroflexota bacterium]
MDARDLFAAELERDEAEIDLGRAALLFARVEYPDLDVDAYLCRFDVMAADMRPRIGDGDEPGRVVGTIAEYLFRERGFAGNEADYYDARNSYLNDVLDRRLGIPISLSAIYLELGKRLGLPFEGVGLPGHFLVRLAHPFLPVLVDPFSQGKLVTEDECLARLRALHGDRVELTPSMLRPVGTRAILFRMLTNLKGVYARQEDYARAVRTIGLMLLVEPAAVAEYRDRGLLRFRMGDLKNARPDLEYYLELLPEAPDAGAIREQLALVERLYTMRN